MMTAQEGMEMLKRQIGFGETHPDYPRVLDIRHFCQQMMGIEPQTDILRRFRRFEDDDLMEQRERITNQLTSLVLSRPRKYWRKIKRVDGVAFSISPATDGQKQAVENMMAALGNFDENKGIFEWLCDRVEMLNVVDPNAWIIFERSDMEGQTRVWPFVVSGKNALNFQIEHGQVIWLTTYVTRTVSGAGGAKKDLKDFLFYGSGFTIRFRAAESTAMEVDEEKVTVQMAAGKPEIFFAKTFIHGYPFCPAIRAGCYPDLHTDGRTFASWFEDARHVLFDLIRDKCYSDVSKTIHFFIKRWEFTKVCTYQEDGWSECYDGRCKNHSTGEVKTCSNCNGTGEAANFSTEQKVMKLKMPKMASELLDLKKLYHNEDLPMDFPAYLRQEIADTEQRVMLAVINPGLLERTVVNSRLSAAADKTATEMNYDYEALYDRLEPFAATISRMMVLGHQVAAAYLGIQPDGLLMVNHQFPRDFKMKTLAQVLADFQSAKDAGAGYAIIVKLRRRVWEKLYEDTPQMLARLETQHRFMPFDDKGADEVAQILAMREPTDPQRILWENHSAIFTEIDSDFPNFYTLLPAKQAAIVAAKVAEFAGRIVPIGIQTPFEPAA